MGVRPCSFFFFFNDTATTEIYTLSLHDALPISRRPLLSAPIGPYGIPAHNPVNRDRKSTRLNSSHMSISYAVFCLKKKKEHGFEQHHDDDEERHLDHDRCDCVGEQVSRYDPSVARSNGATLFRILSRFFLNDTATTEIYTLSLHDALPISEPITAGERSRSSPGSAMFAEPPG